VWVHGRGYVSRPIQRQPGASDSRESAVSVAVVEKTITVGDKSSLTVHRPLRDSLRDHTFECVAMSYRICTVLAERGTGMPAYTPDVNNRSPSRISHDNCHMPQCNITQQFHRQWLSASVSWFA
jgi:hypothetical protein